MDAEPAPAVTGYAEGQIVALTATTDARATRRSRPRRLSTSVSDELLRRIVSGEYAVGTPLPPEPLLVDEFDVSRPVVREAVKSLESAGLVSIRQGDGTVVRDRATWSMLDPRVLRVALVYDTGDRLTDDATELRVELERALIAEAAPKLTEADFAAMAEHLRVMDTATQLVDLQRADLGFHQTYRDRSGNELKSSIVRLLLEEMPPPERLARQSRDMYDVANRQHWEIYRALRDRRTDDAMDAIARHVREMWTWRPHETS
jgi:DNA-binding FadR family transcriptional regulator